MATKTIDGLTIREGRILHVYAVHSVLRQYHTVMNGRRETASQFSFEGAAEAFRNRRPDYQRDSADQVIDAAGMPRATNAYWTKGA